MLDVFAYPYLDGIRMETGVVIADAQKGDELVTTNNMTVAVKQDPVGAPYVATIYPGRPVSTMKTPYRELGPNGYIIHDGFQPEEVNRWKESQLVF